MATIKTAEIEQFVQMVDSNYAGNLAHPELAAAYYPLSLSFETEVNQEIDPFSEEYFQQ
ncbi:hypothetical protein DFO45_2084 [Azorhizobium sp. AG788]|uniref:hypothetical protein n=1 Tax=Azorhizobium sp. AG788 TaxID=2183897 RepID=UPI0010D75758|nr:hypothetical protein [Azorhizobium sp. AG788]TDT96881.1 hypothetical protein DFO45_2084 [Azorhizobium sp. AG788]